MSTLVHEMPAGAVLDVGAHEEFEAGYCAMELVSYMAGEPFSDHPECACPVISTFMRSWNDGIRDKEVRTRLLKPLLPKLIGTRSTKEAEQARAMLCVDWAVRVVTPAWLDLTPSLADHAATLRSLPTIETHEQLAAADAAAYAAAADAVAYAVAYAAAAAAFRPTIDRLNESAVSLVEMMIAVS